MLAQPEGKATYDRLSWEALASAATGMVIVGILSLTIGGVLSGGPADSQRPPISAPDAENLAQGVLSPYHVASFGMELFGRHLIAIEVAGTLLLGGDCRRRSDCRPKPKGSVVRVQGSEL